MTDALDKPNGLAFSPDETILYIADSGGTHRLTGPHHILAFDVRENGTLGRQRTLVTVEPGVPDASAWTRTAISGPAPRMACIASPRMAR